MAELKRITSLEDSLPEEGNVNTFFYQTHSVTDEGPNEAVREKEQKAEVRKIEHRDLQNLEDSEKRKRKIKIIKNLLVISFGFLLLFTAFQSLSNLQSSVNSVQGLGTASLSVIYAALVVSCMFVPTFIIKLIGLKYTLIASILMYSTYFAANFYAHWYTLIPTSIILGLGGAPLWTAKCAYLTETAGQYAAITGQTVDNLVVRFFGVFFMIFQSGQIWGNLIAYHVLSPQTDSANATLELDPTIYETCGANFCNENKVVSNNTNLERPPDSKVYTLCGIYTGCSILSALFVFAFLDPLHREGDEDKKGKARPSFGLLISTFRHLKNPYQILIVPITIFSGLEQAFVIGDYTKAFVSCAWGIHNVGYVMICFGVADALSSIALGQLIKWFGRIVIFTMGALVNVATLITMFLWKPLPDNVTVFFVIAALWGLSDAVWQTQINAVYGILFPSNEAAAFANYRLWESLGFIIAFAYAQFLCINVKMYILLIVLGIGYSGYLAIEIHLRMRLRRQEPSEPANGTFETGMPEKISN
ncbi:protein unc-93 homolog A-like [Limulus polyphemus]|uniref:Protein unc-93 homolog A-like n=1 Tax=Limulus polyphemus TaxID=6850 RepID=A0ABM1BI70_LIMPO|nr:protein unc-93 homolog A-like [Limulus polyphemus]